MAHHGTRHASKVSHFQVARFVLVVSPEIIHRRGSRANPKESAWFRFTGISPSCAGVRPIGCRVYPKVMLRPHKPSPQSAACTYLGRARNQPRHMCLEPITKRIYVSPHARFIETEFP
eukprot:5966455-Pleurochrysis_carterae.AAC.1